MTLYMPVQKCTHCNKTPCDSLMGPIVDLETEHDDIEGMMRSRETYKGPWTSWAKTPTETPNEFVPGHYPDDEPGMQP